MVENIEEFAFKRRYNMRVPNKTESRFLGEAELRTVQAWLTNGVESQVAKGFQCWLGEVRGRK